MYEVFLHSGTSVSSTASGATAGTITISGTGGDGTFANFGVFLDGSTTDVTSVDGDVSISGTGGNGSGSSNHGVLLDTIETISSTGTGAAAATITISGTGGDGTFANFGVFLLGSTTDVTSVDGDVSISGTGGNGSSNNNFGVYLLAIETISSTGTGAAAATITISGTGGDGTSDNYGVYLLGSTTDVTSVDGDVSISGTGGNGSSNSNRGVNIEGDATAQVTSGSLSVMGTAGAGNSRGIVLAASSGGRLVSVGTGTITITADGNGTRPDLRAGADSIIGGPMATGAITINADSVEFRDTLSVESDGALTIQPRTASTTIGLGNTATGDLNLDATELGFLQDGFSSITIGDATNSTGAVDIDSSTFIDPVTIIGGSIDVDGLDAGANAVNLIARNGGDINDGSTGTDVTGSTVTATGNVKPGQSPGILTVAGNFAFSDNDTFTVEIGGTSPGNTVNDHDQLNATGSVTIGSNVTLTTSAFGGFSPTVAQTFTIIDRTAGTGTFQGLAENATISNFLGSGLNATITYAGGTGDDVVLTVVATPTTTVSLNGNDLQIQDTNSDDTNDTITVSTNGTIVTFNDPNNTISVTGVAGATGDNTNTVTVPLTSFTGGIIADLLGGDDSLTVSFADGNFTRTVTYNGGTQNTSPNGDTLTLSGGGTFTTVTHTLIDNNSGDRKSVV
jgi:hypothetical protein